MYKKDYKIKNGGEFMKIINNLKKYNMVYIGLLLSLYLAAGPINDILQTQSEQDSKSEDNKIVKTLRSLATKIGSYTHRKTKKDSKSKEKSKSDIIIDETTDLVKTELKQSTKDIVEILDTTVADGKLKLGKGLKLRSQCKKKTAETTNKLEEIISDTVTKLETKDEDKNLLIKDNTDKFIKEAKQEVSEIQKNMSTEMRKALGKKPEVVFDCTDKAKTQIAEFEDKVITKIEEFSDKLKQDVKSEIA